MGKKTIILVGIIGLFLVLAVYSNLSAWNAMNLIVKLQIMNEGIEGVFATIG